MNRRMRTRMSGGVRGGRLAAALLLDLQQLITDAFPWLNRYFDPLQFNFALNHCH
jgi:hypothetical protein